MKVAKKIFVGSIILLLATTPLIATAGKNEINKTSSMNVDEVYSLGQVNISHEPMFNVPDKKGMRVEFWPADTYDFNFTEVNGTVQLNFILTIKHQLNRPPIPYFAEFIFRHNFRYTWVNRLYIHNPENDEDIYSIENKTVCNTDYWVYYNITMTGKYLTTNGENKTLTFWLYGGPAITPIKFIYTMISLIVPGLLRNWLIPYCNPYDYIPITIHPI